VGDQFAAVARSGNRPTFTVFQKNR
jgi:hypothetical protein